jgi:hypothetical protein
VTKEVARGLAWKAFAEPWKRAIIAAMATTKIILNIVKYVVTNVVGVVFFCKGNGEVLSV